MHASTGHDDGWKDMRVGDVVRIAGGDVFASPHAAHDYAAELLREFGETVEVRGIPR